MEHASIDFRKDLNDQQYAAVTADKGPALVLAGAGSGKTRTLIYRVAWLLSQGVQPWEILLLTFTNKAAQEMLKRVEALTGIARQRFWGGTFHSIGQRILRRYGAGFSCPSDFTIIDEKEAEVVLSDAIRAKDPNWLKRKDYPKVRLVTAILSYARNTQQTVAAVLARKYPFFRELAEQLEAIATGYQEQKRSQVVVDFDDLLEYWFDLLRYDAQAAAELPERFHYLLVDEYQDTNKLQGAIVDRLAVHHRIMAVGDEAQCIYTWRGAHYDNIVLFPDRHPGTVIYKIDKNYRSTPTIVHFANAALARQPRPFNDAKQLRPARVAAESLPYWITTLDARQQARFIAQRIQGLAQEGRSLSDIAVLYRAHHQALELQMELAQQGIPFIITSGIKFLEQAHVKDLIAQLRFAYNPRDKAAFMRFTTLLPKIGLKTAQRLFHLAEQQAQEQASALIEALNTSAVTHKVPAEAREDFKALSATLQKLEREVQQMPQGETDSKGGQVERQGGCHGGKTSHRWLVWRLSSLFVPQLAIPP